MGLDQYLRAKTNTVEHKPATGACGGIFPIAPADNGTTEIGYWRKAYSVSDYLRETLDIDDEFNLEDREITYDQILYIIKHAENLIQEDVFEDEYEKADWTGVVTAFTKAKYILEQDAEAEIL